MVSQHGAPLGLHCHSTPNAYLTDGAWLELSTIIEKGVRAMPVIRYHLYWWVSLSLYGFGYHVNVDAANENFTKLKIWIIKKRRTRVKLAKHMTNFRQRRTKAVCILWLILWHHTVALSINRILFSISCRHLRKEGPEIGLFH